MSTVLNNKNIDNLCIDNIRVLCSEMIDRAKSGHPGMAIGAAPILHTLYTRFLNCHFTLSSDVLSELVQKD